MKKTLYILLVFVLMTGSLSAKKRQKNKKSVVLETIDTLALNDTLTEKQYEFPMILVGKSSYFPDSCYVRLTEEPQDTLQNDSESTLDRYSRTLMEFFVRNIVYPNKMKEKKAEDVMKLRLKLNKKGKIILCEVLDACNAEMENEVLRVSKLLPALFPVDKSGKPADIILEVPISFKLLRL